MKDRGYISIARTVIISAISGLLAFGGAVLYLGGDDSEPSPGHLHADIFNYSQEVLEIAADFALCADEAAVNWVFDVERNINRDRVFSIYDAAKNTCWGDAIDQFHVEVELLENY